jgi:hypothetical protein
VDKTAEGPLPEVFMWKLMVQQMGCTMIPHGPCLDLGKTVVVNLHEHFNLLLKLWLSFGDLIIVGANLM